MSIETKFGVACLFGIMPEQFPVTDAKPKIPASAVILLNQVFSALRSGLSEQRRQDVKAIDAGIGWDVDPGQSSAACSEVDSADDFL